MSAVARAIAAAAKAASRMSGVPIVYQRGEDTIELVAIPGLTRYEVVELEGHVTVHFSRDYLIVATDLVLDGEVIQPQVGDTIVETLCDGEHTYQLLDLPTEHCWRWSDEHRVRIRLHTKEIETP